MDHPQSFNWTLSAYRVGVVAASKARGRHALQTPRLYPPAVTVTFTDIVTATPTSLLLPLPTDTSGDAMVDSSPGIALNHSHSGGEGSAGRPLLSQPDTEAWVNHIHRLLPVIISFAAIGVLAVISGLLFLAYRFYTIGKERRRAPGEGGADPNHPDPPQEGPTVEKGSKSPAPSQTLSRILPWLAVRSPQREHEQFGPDRPGTSPPMTLAVRQRQSLDAVRPVRNKTSEGKPLTRHIAKLFASEPAGILNIEKPISSTFVPLHESPLTLVTRAEIWQDPQRRRGVDELGLWEKKNKQKDGQPPDERTLPPWQREDSSSGASPQPSSSVAHSAIHRSSSMTIQEASHSQHPAHHGHDVFSGFSSTVQHTSPTNPPTQRSDVAIAREALAASNFENSSSQWFGTSGSKSF